MQRLIFLAGLIFAISCAGFAQKTHSAAGPCPRDTIENCYSDPDSCSISKAIHDSVPEIFWNTKCIKGGWTKVNPLRDSTGKILCDSTAAFIMPVTGKLLRGYSSHHTGWDVSLSAGTPVQAAMGGRVRYAQYNGSGYGNLAIIRHKSGLEIYYSHLSKLLVKPGQYVEAGDTIGLGGATGRATTNHLHMEFRICDNHFDISKIYTQNDSVIYLWKLNQPRAVELIAQNTDYHTVAKGETLTKIAKQYGTTVSSLLKLNNLKSTSILRIGQKIRIS